MAKPVAPEPKLKFEADPREIKFVLDGVNEYGGGDAIARCKCGWEGVWTFDAGQTESVGTTFTRVHRLLIDVAKDFANEDHYCEAK